MCLKFCGSDSQMLGSNFRRTFSSYPDWILNYISTIYFHEGTFGNFFVVFLYSNENRENSSFSLEEKKRVRKYWGPQLPEPIL